MAVNVITEHTAPFEVSETINALVERFPHILPVLHAFGLDTCCGGSLPLQVAAAQHNIDLNTLIGALQDAVAADA